MPNTGPDITPLTIPDLLAATGGHFATQQLIANDTPLRVWTDTRTIRPGDFFLPLSGANFHGHDYLAAAYEQGAVGAFVAADKLAKNPGWSKHFNLLAVPDPLQAYLQLARYHRNQVDPIVVALTGSSGKTTTKEMLRATFAPLLKTQATDKNFNNEVGVSQTLLALKPQTQLIIVEMGMRGPHQIDLLSEHALPDVALITNIGPAHIEMLGSLDGIAQAKLEIVVGMDAEKGTLVINGDDPMLTEWTPKLWAGRTERYTLKDAEGISMTPQGGVRFKYKDVEVTLPVPGEHMVSNALGVLKVGEVLGYDMLDLARGLSAFHATEGRWQMAPLAGFDNAFVINDAYNANPDSLKASLKTLLETPLEGLSRILILGGMKELGEFSGRYHEELGRWLVEHASTDSVSQLFTVGEEGYWLADAAKNAGAPFPIQAELDAQAVIRAMSGRSLNHTLLFLKGSRAYHLDQIPQELAHQAVHPQ